MNPLRVLRTLQHVTVGQAAARIQHELWLRQRRTIAWHANDSHQLSQAHVPVPQESSPRFHALLDLWQRGRVSYVGLEGGNADWQGAGKPKLWRYERQYHSELVALAARAIEDPQGPWLLAGREMQDEWAAACPPERGEAWEPYPTARRILSWAEAAAIEPRIAAPQMAQRLAFHLAHLSAHLEHHLRGNHLLCDAAALVAGGAMLAGPEGEAALRAGAALLERELLTQVLGDGGYAERTVQYHAVVMKDALLALELSRARKASLRPRIGEALAKMALWLWRTRRPDGSWPLVNDAAPQSFELAHENLVRATRLQLFSEPSPSSATETALPDTGWTFLRDLGSELFFDTGAIGPSDQPGHGHDDALAYELRWYGMPVVSDSGVTTYERDPIRDFERSARAHATLSVNGRGVDEVWASFRVARRGKTERLPVPALDSRLHALRGRAHSYQGHTHDRALVFWPARALLVFDRVSREARGAEVLSHIPLDPGWSAAEATGALFLLGPGARGLQLHVLRGTLERIVCGANSPRDGWVGEGFGRPRERSSISLRADAGGDCLYAIVAPGVTVREGPRGFAFRAPGSEIALDLDALTGA